MKESKFQSSLIKLLKNKFNGDCMILKNDPKYIQGIPDLLILIKDKWIALECKRAIDSPRRPNQEYYIDYMNNMSFAKVICPENMEEVLKEIDIFILGKNDKGRRRKRNEV